MRILASAAVVDAGSVYVGSRDGCIHAFRIQDGGDEQQFCSSDIITSTPIIRGGTVYFGSFDGHVYAAREGQGILWKHDMQGAVTTDLGLAGGRIVAGSRSYDLSGLTLRSGIAAWPRYFWFSWVESSLAVAGTQIFIGSSDACSVYSFDARTGARRWRSRVPGWTWPRPALGPKTLYAGVIGTSDPYLGVRKGGLAALDRRTGRLKWVFSSSAPVRSESWYGFASSPLVAHGMVFAADLQGNVYAFRDR